MSDSGGMSHGSYNEVFEGFFILVYFSFDVRFPIFIVLYCMLFY